MQGVLQPSGGGQNLGIPVEVEALLKLPQRHDRDLLKVLSLSYFKSLVALTD